MYLTIAALARQFDMDLYKTTIHDVRVGRDYISPFPTEGFCDVRAIISNAL